MQAAALIRSARQKAGLTQQALAFRLGVPQSVVARMERPGSNPTWDTVMRALGATGHELELRKSPPSSIDETLVARMLRIPPGARVTTFERSYADARKIALAGARSRGELA